MSRPRDGSRAPFSAAWIPVTAAAEMLGISKQRVHQLIAAGALQEQRIHTTVLVSTRSCEARNALMREEGSRDAGAR